MALKQSKQVRAGVPVPSANEGNDLIAVTAEYVVKTGDASGDIVEMQGIPPCSVVVDFIVDQNGIGGTIDAGIMSGELGKLDNTRTVCNCFLSAAASANAGLIRATNSLIGTVPQSQDERGFGIKFLAAPVVGKTVRATLVCRPAPVAMV